MDRPVPEAGLVTGEQERQMSDASQVDPANAAPKARPNGNPASREGQVREAQLSWDDRRMATTFANVVNIQSTREQVDLFFGTNQTWNVANDKMLTIELSNRLILSPFAAKRLSVALNGVMREYETRYGRLDVEG
jgi:hypothetical protein